MDKTLAELLSDGSPRNLDLRRLMHICRSGAQDLYVVCVGAGDAFINRYWPHLTGAVNLKTLRLMVADKKSLQDLVPAVPTGSDGKGLAEKAEHVRKLYAEFINDVNRKKVKYVDFNDPVDRGWYDHIRADIVFVLVPDYDHLEVAKEWLGRSTLILVEKPYSHDPTEIADFNKLMDKMMERAGGDASISWVVPFDHYLGKIYRYAIKRYPSALPERLGTIRDISFKILEPDAVEPWRSESLRSGMVSDLFSHVLAMLSIELDLSLLNMQQVRQVKVSSHFPRGDSFSGETFAYLELEMKDFHGASVRVTGSVGKGVGNEQAKELLFEGSKAFLRFDLRPGVERNISIRETDLFEDRLFKVAAGHAEFLDSLLQGEFAKDSIGGLTAEAAKSMIQVLDGIHNKIERFVGSIPKYEVGASEDAILERAFRVI